MGTLQRGRRCELYDVLFTGERVEIQEQHGSVCPRAFWHPRRFSVSVVDFEHDEHDFERDDRESDFVDGPRQEFIARAPLPDVHANSSKFNEILKRTADAQILAMRTVKELRQFLVQPSAVASHAHAPSATSDERPREEGTPQDAKLQKTPQPVQLAGRIFCGRPYEFTADIQQLAKSPRNWRVKSFGSLGGEIGFSLPPVNKDIFQPCSSKGFKNDELFAVRSFEIHRSKNADERFSVCAAIFQLNNCGEVTLTFPELGFFDVSADIDMFSSLGSSFGLEGSRAGIFFHDDLAEDVRSDSVWDFTFDTKLALSKQKAIHARSIQAFAEELRETSLSSCGNATRFVFCMTTSGACIDEKRRASTVSPSTPTKRTLLGRRGRITAELSQTLRDGVSRDVAGAHCGVNDTMDDLL